MIKESFKYTFRVITKNFSFIMIVFLFSVAMTMLPFILTDKIGAKNAGVILYSFSMFFGFVYAKASLNLYDNNNKLEDIFKIKMINIFNFMFLMLFFAVVIISPMMIAFISIGGNLIISSGIIIVSVMIILIYGIAPFVALCEEGTVFSTMKKSAYLTKGNITKIFLYYIVWVFFILMTAYIFLGILTAIDHGNFYNSISDKKTLKMEINDKNLSGTSMSDSVFFIGSILMNILTLFMNQGMVFLYKFLKNLKEEKNA